MRPVAVRVWGEWFLIVAAAFLAVRIFGAMGLAAAALVYSAIVTIVQRQRKRSRYRTPAVPPVPDAAARQKLTDQMAEAVRAAEERATMRKDGEGY